MRDDRALTLITIAFSAIVALDVRAEPPPKNVELRQPSLPVRDGKWSLDGERIEPFKICKVSPGESDCVLKSGALTKVFRDKDVAGLDFFGSPLESSLRATVYYQVHFEDEILEEISDLTQLQYLNLHGVDLTRGIGLEFLAKLKHLRVIRFTDCNVEFKEILEHLPKCPNLEILKLWNGEYQWPDESERFTKRRVIGEQEIALFTNNSPKLFQLYLHSSELYEPEAISRFAKLSALRNLDIMPVGNMPAETLKASPQQSAEQKKLEMLFIDRGYIEWRQPSDSWKKSFRFRSTMISVSEDE